MGESQAASTRESVPSERTLSVFEATMQFASFAMNKLNQSHARPGEEALTSAFMGCVLSNFGWCVKAFGPSDVPGLTCEWAQYSKAGRGPTSESRTGADFALLVKMPHGGARLAIFQAKSDKAINVRAGYIKLHHELKERGPNGEIRTQMGALFQHGNAICKRPDYSPADVQDLSFIHYLAQLETGICCVQLCDLGTQIRDTLLSIRVRDYKVPKNAESFLNVLIDVLCPQPKYWKDVNVEFANGVLPPLLELMDIYVGEDGRDSPIDLGEQYKVVLDVAAAPSSPNPAAKPEKGLRQRRRTSRPGST